jgi:hypothetical protein
LSMIQVPEGTLTMPLSVSSCVGMASFRLVWRRAACVAVERRRVSGPAISSITVPHRRRIEGARKLGVRLDWNLGARSHRSLRSNLVESIPDSRHCASIRATAPAVPRSLGKSGCPAGGTPAAHGRAEFAASFARSGSSRQRFG